MNTTVFCDNCGAQHILYTNISGRFCSRSCAEAFNLGADDLDSPDERPLELKEPTSPQHPEEGRSMNDDDRFTPELPRPGFDPDEGAQTRRPRRIKINMDPASPPVADGTAIGRTVTAACGSDQPHRAHMISVGRICSGNLDIVTEVPRHPTPVEVLHDIQATMQRIAPRHSGDMRDLVYSVERLAALVERLVWWTDLNATEEQS